MGVFLFAWISDYTRTLTWVTNAKEDIQVICSNEVVVEGLVWCLQRWPINGWNMFDSPLVLQILFSWLVLHNIHFFFITFWGVASCVISGKKIVIERKTINRSCVWRYVDVNIFRFLLLIPVTTLAMFCIMQLKIVFWKSTFRN